MGYNTVQKKNCFNYQQIFRYFHLQSIVVRFATQRKKPGASSNRRSFTGFLYAPSSDSEQFERTCNEHTLGSSFPDSIEEHGTLNGPQGPQGP